MINFDKIWKSFLNDTPKKEKILSEQFGSFAPDPAGLDQPIQNPALAAQAAADKAKADQEQRLIDIESLKKQIAGIRADLSSKEGQLKQLQKMQGQVGLAEVHPTNAAGATPEGSGKIPYSIQPDVPNSNTKK